MPHSVNWAGWASQGDPSNDANCCECCGGPCYDKKNGYSRNCCTPYCCTCYPPGNLKCEVRLSNCDPGGCNFVLGTITLQAGGGGGGYPAGTEDALCQRIGDSQLSAPTPGEEARPELDMASYNCRKQICNRKDHEDKPEGIGGVDIREIWSGSARLCCPEDCETCGEASDPEFEGECCQGQLFEASVCCCAGSADKCEGHRYSCQHLRQKALEDGRIDNTRCSCPCYSVNLHSVPIDIEQGLYCSELIDPSSDCFSQNNPGCPTLESCPMDITNCFCGGVADPAKPWLWWMIKAQRELIDPLSCDCCPGRPNMPPGSPGSGGCKSGAILTVLITPEDI